MTTRSTKGLLVGGLVIGAATITVLTQGTGMAGPVVKPATVAKKAGTAPPASATKATTAGNKAAKVSTANHATDHDSFWIEKVDVDGDGDIEDTNFVWDDEDKVAFAWSSGEFTCRNGGKATADLLVATYAAGNSMNKPAGSGFWVADLDAGDCAAQVAGLWGCRFDAQGNETECGMATLDEKTDTLVIVTARK